MYDKELILRIRLAATENGETITNRQAELISEIFNKAGLRKLQKDVHENAQNKGWWINQPSFGTFISNFHGEISEAWEEYRKGHGLKEVYYVDGKPEGVPVELADCVIRIMDFCEGHNIDLEQAIRTKHEYNKTRSFRHGNKKA